MRTALFIILLLLFIISPIKTSKAKSQNIQQIRITASVDEHLTYLIKGTKIYLSTNSKSGFLFITQSQAIKFSQPVEKTLEASASFILVNNF